MGQRDDRQQIEAEAAEWVIRLADLSPDDPERGAFAHWCAQSPGHLRAFDFAQATWGDLAGLRHSPGYLQADIPNFAPDPGVAAAAIPTPQGKRWGLRAGVAVVCLAVALGASNFWYGNLLTMLAADYQTAPGELRRVTLPDGSLVELASGSAMALRFTEAERRIELLAGAAYFTAAPKSGTEQRPFIVEGGGGTATALGTEFVVELLADSIEVTVLEHEVRVRLTEAGSGSESAVLSPGQAVRYSAGSGLGEIREKDVALTAAWRRGKLVFDQVPLADVVAELNRYRRGQIVIADSALAGRTVSGVFDAGQLDGALATITRELRIKSASVPPLVTLLY